MPGDQHTVSAREQLDTSWDKQVSFRLPLAIDQRLDALMDRTHAVGERTNRRELLAALILATDLTGDEISDALRKYRRAFVRDAVLDGGTEGNLVSFTRHAPGPRARRRT